MRELAFRLVNVFAQEGNPFSGNPLCVFADGSGLTDEAMQAIARQTNLSETTFLLPSSTRDATARVRIFTPSLEMPFAGHPTLGTAHVVSRMHGGARHIVLEMRAGLVSVGAEDNLWTLETAHPPRTRAPEASLEVLAAMLGVAKLGGAPLWVNTGVEQLVIPLATAADVTAAQPKIDMLTTLAARTSGDKSSAYVWAHVGDPREGKVVARYFFVQNGGVLEDPATGSACANLGGWLLANGATEPVQLAIDQGSAVGRPSTLGLRVAKGRVFVSGLVAEAGSGVMLV
jgi:PhzF family phenazine biosynthesis protein